MRDLTWDIDGAARYPRAALSALPEFDAVVAALPFERAGIRLNGIDGLKSLLGPRSSAGEVARSLAGEAAMPVRAILFDKSPDTNWALGWHQDRTIAVRRRIDVEGFGPWGTKGGMTHVEPPFAVMEAMVTLRIHLDDVPADNAPLLIALGSHRLGRVLDLDAGAAAARCEVHRCLADRGDIWAYATPILHASAAAANHAHRRVLQVDFSAVPLPGGLEWLGL